MNTEETGVSTKTSTIINKNKDLCEDESLPDTKGIDSIESSYEDDGYPD
jgi:hypothetical protein